MLAKYLTRNELIPHQLFQSPPLGLATELVTNTCDHDINFSDHPSVTATGEGGLEVFDDFGDDVGIGKVCAVCEAFVFQPEDAKGECVGCG